MLNSLEVIKEKFKKIQYNSPVILTYAILSLIVLFIGFLTGGMSNALLFSVYRAPLTNPLTFFRLFGYVLGHANLNHYLANFLLILVIGPVLEEKYGSVNLLLMILATAFVSGIAFMIFNSQRAGLGASGILFMMILLSSFTNMKHGMVPLTFILIVVLYFGREIYASIAIESNVSHFGHIVGGLCGAALGFYINKLKMEKETYSDSTVVESKMEL